MSEGKKENKHEEETARLVNRNGKGKHTPSNSDEHTLHTATNPYQRPRQQQTRPRKPNLIRPMQPAQPHRSLHRNTHFRRHSDALPGVQNSKAQNNLQTSNADRHDDQEDDNPRNARHFLIADAVRQYLAEVEEDLAALVEDLDAGFDLEVLADGGVQGVQGGFRVPEEGWVVEEVGRCEKTQLAKCRG
jgi:hypothetical protein